MASMDNRRDLKMMEFQKKNYIYIILYYITIISGISIIDTFLTPCGNSINIELSHDVRKVSII